MSSVVAWAESSSIPADYDNVPAGRSSSIPADYVSAGHVLVPADTMGNSPKRWYKMRRKYNCSSSGFSDEHVVGYLGIELRPRFSGMKESKKMRKTMLKQQFTEFSVTEEEGLHKGYDRFQKILSQLNQVQARPDNDDINLKFLRALPSSWSQVALALKTRGGLDLMSFEACITKTKVHLKLDVRIGSSYGVESCC
ncbi:hypothetical protein Tco_0628314 [Tanacetum coccineum]|uniref:Uncharacterized protein n=1 Tax=Tanacetum coccineum TaxID=301880 RepID=A0ABQ4WPZ5_9ASTR